MRAQRLPGHGRLDVATGRSGRTRDPVVDRRARRRRRPARPVVRPPPDRALHPTTRAGSDQPRQPPRAAAPPGLRGLRAPAHADRRPVVARPARRRRPRARPRRHAAAAPTPSPTRPRRRLGPARVAVAWRRVAQCRRRRVPHRHARRHARRHGRRRSCAASRPSRCRLPAPGPIVAGRRPRSGRPRGARRAIRRRRVHPTSHRPPTSRCSITNAIVGWGPSSWLSVPYG